MPVARGEGPHVGDQLHLGDAGGDAERPVEPHGLGDLVEELVQRVDADRREHLADLVLGVRREGHVRQCTDAGTRCQPLSRRRPRVRTS